MNIDLRLHKTPIEQEIPIFEDKRQLYKHIMEFYIFACLLVMIILHVIDLAISKIPFLGTTDGLLVIVYQAILLLYADFHDWQGRVVAQMPRITRNMRYRPGIEQCYDADGSEYFDAVTLAVENQFGMKHWPVLIKTPDKAYDDVKLSPYFNELPDDIKQESVISELEIIKATRLIGYFVYSIIWDRPGYHKIVTDNEKEPIPVSFTETIIYCKKDIFSILQLHRGKAFAAGWSDFTVAAVGTLNLEFLYMIRDTCICRVEEPGEPAEKLTESESQRMTADTLIYMADREREASKFLQGWYDQQANEQYDQSVQKSAQNILDTERYLADNPHAAQADFNKVQNKELENAKKQTRNPINTILAVIIPLVILGIVALIMK